MLRKKIAKLFSTALTRSTRFTPIELNDLIAQPNPLRELMLHYLQSTGPMKMQQYWRMALTDPDYGYYRDRNVFAKQGDFITSPEISPLFGQMVGTWIAHFLQFTKIMNPTKGFIEKPFRIVELGGGRGTLIKDILRTFQDLKINNHFDLSFIEVAQFNRKAQQEAVQDQFKKQMQYFRYVHENQTGGVEEFVSENKHVDITLRWFNSIEDLLIKDNELRQKKHRDIPFTIFVMNEFFDALPTTTLQFTEAGWRQMGIFKSNNPQFPLELSVMNQSINEGLLPKISDAKIGDRIQVSYPSLLIMDMMAKVVKVGGGAILNIDYGQDRFFQDSIRAIKDHKYVDSPYFWQMPGACDLSAYVNFSSLAQFATANEGITAFQTIPQGYFLEAMGINTRIELMLKKHGKRPGYADRIESEYKRLVSAEEMGQIYKVQIITRSDYGQVYPFISEKEGVY